MRSSNRGIGRRLGETSQNLNRGDKRGGAGAGTAGAEPAAADAMYKPS
jgi:hypothetical protein